VIRQGDNVLHALGPQRTLALVWGAGLATLKGKRKLAARCEHLADLAEARREVMRVRASARWSRPDWTAEEIAETTALANRVVRAMDAPRPQRRTTRLDWSERRRRYARVALEGECDRVANAQYGERNCTLASASYRLGGLVGAGLLDDPGTADALFFAARECALPEREARAVIRSALRAGARRPREVPA
jgi:hypothetical protein